MRHLAVAIVISLLLAPPAVAQEENAIAADEELAAAIERLRTPVTQIEKLQETVGTTIVSRFKSVGDIPGRYRLDLAVTACRVSDEVAGQTLQGVAIDAVEDGAVGGRDETRGWSRRVYIDEAELPRLLDALKAITRVKMDGSGYDDFEATYRTAGGLTVGTYSSPTGQGGISAAVELRERGRWHGTLVDLSMDQLSRLRELIEIARGTFATPTQP